MNVKQDQVILLPAGTVVQRVGTGQDLVLGGQAMATSLHAEECYVTPEGSIRSYNGFYAKLVGSAVTEGDLVIANGETVFVQPYSSVFLAVVESKANQPTVKPIKLESGPPWDAIIGSALVLVTAAGIKFGWHHPIVGY